MYTAQGSLSCDKSGQEAFSTNDEDRRRKAAEMARQRATEAGRRRGPRGEILKGENFPGSDIEESVVADLRACQNQCEQWGESCELIAYRAGDKRCWIKGQYIPQTGQKAPEITTWVPQRTLDSLGKNMDGSGRPTLRDHVFRPSA